MATSPPADIPTLSQIRDETQRVFGRRPCLWQLKAAQAVLKNDKDVICISGTGSGKTLTFWMPLLFRKKHIQIVVTPLNILGKQNVDQLARVGIDAISITRDTSTPQDFKDIGDGKYQAIVVNPEILLKNGGQFEALWKNKPFVARLLSFIWDEAHCVKTWSEFRGKYKEASRLRYLIPRNIPFFLASATLPPPVLEDVMATLQIRRDQCEFIQRSNDRPNIHITVRKIKHSLTSYEDLSFLIPEKWTPDQPIPPKFVVFFDNIPDSMAAVDYLRSRLPQQYQEKIRWFNADMTADYHEDEVKNMTSGDTWGLCCTDSFGMGVDLPDIKIVVQWRASCSMSALWQRFGRGARDQSLSAKAVFLVESQYFDEDKQKKAEAKTKRVEKAAAAAKRKAEDELPRPRKTAVIGSSSANRHALPAASLPVSNDVEMEVEQVPDGNTPRVSGLRQCAERRGLYNQASEKTSGNVFKTKESDELEPALDDMVNAARRPWKCFRAPLMVYFGNDKIVFSDSREDCSPTGCTRCCPPSISAPQVCCELCSPDAFADLVIPAPVAPPKRVTAPPPKGARRFKPDFKMERRDGDLQRDLHEFRKQEMVTRYGAAMANNLGPAAIMSDEVLARIVACAHANRIETIDHLKQEVKWFGASRYGARVIELIRKHRGSQTDSSPSPHATTVQSGQPLVEDRALVPVSPQTPREQVASGRGEPPSNTTSRIKSRTCGKCGAKGHISSNRLCPRYSPKKSREPVADQNEPPQDAMLPSTSRPACDRSHTPSHPSLPTAGPSAAGSVHPSQRTEQPTNATLTSATPTTPLTLAPHPWQWPSHHLLVTPASRVAFHSPASATLASAPPSSPPTPAHPQWTGHHLSMTPTPRTAHHGSLLFSPSVTYQYSAGALTSVSRSLASASDHLSRTPILPSRFYPSNGAQGR